MEENDKILAQSVELEIHNGFLFGEEFKADVLQINPGHVATNRRDSWEMLRIFWPDPLIHSRITVR